MTIGWSGRRRRKADLSMGSLGDSKLTTVLLVVAAGVILAAVAFQRPRSAADRPTSRMAEIGTRDSAAALGFKHASASPKDENEWAAAQKPLPPDGGESGKKVAHLDAKGVEAIEVRAEVHMDNAYDLARKRDLEGAIREFRAVLKECPGSEKCPMALYQIGIALQASRG